MSLYLLDTTVLIAHLRGDDTVTDILLKLLANGHTLGTCCVNVAEVERGLRPKERKSARTFLDRLRFLQTDRQAARRAGQYQARLQAIGRTMHTPDALVAGTARATGAVLMTDDAGDFPLSDVRVAAPSPS